jgi:hypothetical protein
VRIIDIAGAGVYACTIFSNNNGSDETPGRRDKPNTATIDKWKGDLDDRLLGLPALNPEHVIENTLWFVSLCADDIRHREIVSLLQAM